MGGSGHKNWECKAVGVDFRQPYKLRETTTNQFSVFQMNNENKIKILIGLIGYNLNYQKIFRCGTYSKRAQMISSVFLPPAVDAQLVDIWALQVLKLQAIANFDYRWIQVEIVVI